MGSWSTSAPTNAISNWTSEVHGYKTGTYYVGHGSNRVYLNYNCHVLASCCWLATGQLCARVKNYSCAIGNTGPKNGLNTNASIVNESGTTVYATASNDTMGDSSETTYGHYRGTWYYTFNVGYQPSSITCGIRDNSGSGTATTKVTPSTRPAITLTITLNQNGGSGLTATTVTRKEKATYGDLPKPRRRNYKFLGWSTTTSSANIVSSTTTITQSANFTLYAIWQELGTLYVKIDGAWKSSATIYTKINGAWVPDYT